jgi:hypothetical protein
MHQDMMHNPVSAPPVPTEDSVTKSIETYTAQSLPVCFWASPWA